MDPFDPKAVGAAYDAAADEYVAAYADDLDDLPLDRSILDQAAQMLIGAGPVLDLGCGPRQVARYLVDQGLDVVGLDLAPGMLQFASRHTPGAGFACGDMRALPFGDQAFCGVVAFYSVQHLLCDSCCRQRSPRSIGS
ncbi:MAG: class I SAM-dependent methyltransferase [Acidimicrobiales bacterium]